MNPTCLLRLFDKVLMTKEAGEAGSLVLAKSKR